MANSFGASPYAQAADIAAPFASLGKQMFMGQKAFEEGREKGAMSAAKVRAYQASANYNNQKAGEIQRRAQYQNPEFADQIGGAAAGLNSAQTFDLGSFLKQGNWGTNPAAELPAGQEGPPRPELPKAQPDWYNPEIRRRFDAGRLSHMMNLGGTGDSNAGSMSKAFSDALDTSRGSDAYSQGGANALNGVSAAQKGNMYHFAEYGTGNQGTGQVQFNQPYLSKNRSEIVENSAQAGNASASAAMHRAQIPEIQARTDLARSKIGEQQTMTMPDGTTVVTGPAKTGKPPTEFQGKSSLFGARMRESADILDALDGQYSTAGALAAGGSGVASTALNPMLSANTQKAVQAKRDFINAALRQESGAAIGPSEFANADRQYFPQPGDSQEVIKQKQENREIAIYGMNNLAGPHAFDPKKALAQQEQRQQTQQQKGSYKEYGYTTPNQPVLEAKQLIAKKPSAKAEAVKRLEAMGITNHGIK